TNLYMDDYGPKRLMGMEENPPITDVSPNHGGTTGLEMGGISSCGRDPWNHLGPLCDSFHEDRGYLDCMSHPDSAR
ncbi:UNVERIFIED_CONTAM: hypothetical protein Sindi_2875700, partial [Sesamum indicum]